MNEKLEWSAPKVSEESPEDIKQRLGDPAYLPTQAEVLRAFTKPGKTPLEAVGETGDVQVFAWRHGGYHEFLTEEYMDALAEHVAKRVAHIHANKGSRAILLEVGAGGGRLSYFLNEKLKKFAPETFEVVACDIETPAKTVFPVENVDYKVALQKYSPDIVISSWMPGGEDWTKDFRDTPSVSEYIVIGDDGATGQYWETWGDPIGLILDADEDESPDKYYNETPPYREDGFQMHHLGTIEQLQIPVGLSQVRSCTVSFTRKE